MMKTLFTKRSTNGRFGVEVVGDLELPEGESFEARPRAGHLVPLGSRGGMACFRFEADASAVPACFVVAGGDLEPAGAGTGVVVVARVDLQSHDVATLLHVTPGGVFQRFGYKRRGSEFVLVLPGGDTKTPSAGILLAAGIISSNEEPKPLPAPPALGGALADALRKAGLV